jgi:hypothetical protein
MYWNIYELDKQKHFIVCLSTMFDKQAEVLLHRNCLGFNKHYDPFQISKEE